MWDRDKWRRDRGGRGFRIAYLAEKRVLKEKGRVVNQKNHDESIRPFDDAQGRPSSGEVCGVFQRAHWSRMFDFVGGPTDIGMMVSGEKGGMLIGNGVRGMFWIFERSLSEWVRVSELYTRGTCLRYFI